MVATRRKRTGTKQEPEEEVTAQEEEQQQQQEEEEHNGEEAKEDVQQVEGEDQNARQEEEEPKEEAPEEPKGEEEEQQQQQPPAEEDKSPQVAAAAAAAAAVAAKLMNKHQQQEYPISSGAEYGDQTNKRPRDGDGFDEPDRKRVPEDAQQYDTQDGITETLMVPSALVGRLIGRGGETIRQMQQSTDTHIQIDHASQGTERKITITGKTEESVARAKAAILTTDSQDSSKTVECPPSLVGKIIGRGGETIRALQTASDARISVNQDFPPEVPRHVIITGKPEAVERAELMVNELIHGEPGSAQSVILRVCQKYGIGETDLVLAPKMVIGRIIGRGGETIKNIQKVSGATVQIDQSDDPCKISISGQQSTVDQAKALIAEIMNGGDPFAPNPYSGGGYGGQQQQQQYGGYGGYGGGYGGQQYGSGYGAGGYGGYGGYGEYGAAPAAGGYDYQQAAQDPNMAAPAAGGQWIEYRDDQNRPYYYNTVTGVTQWEKPPEM